MKLSEIKFTSFNSKEFWAKYIQEPVSVVTLQAEIYYLSKKNPQIESEIQKSDVVVADGVGLTVGAFLHGNRVKRSTGIGLLEALIKYNPETPTFLWGATAQNVERAAKNYQNMGLNVVGFSDGYSGTDENIFHEINESGARVVFVGMNNPRQIELVNRIKTELRTTALTVGGAFDVGAGEFKRSPKIISQLGLEFLWRVFEDPKRIKRFPHLVGFVFVVINEWFL